MEQAADQLNSIIRSKHNTLNDTGVIEIAPADLAAEAYNEIDPKRIAPLLVQIAAILELRQLARAICRRQQQRDSERIDEQGNLFDSYLQPRYPATRSPGDGETEEVYVLRAHLTLKERLCNIERPRREAKAKTTHADALQAETDHLIRIGKLPAEEEILP
jgi:hypothetical protein